MTVLLLAALPAGIKSHGLPHALFHVNQSLCVCVYVCACCQPQSPCRRTWPLMHTKKIPTHADTHTHACIPHSGIMFVPCSADLFAGQQLQELFNMRAREKSYNMTKGNKLQFNGMTESSPLISFFIPVLVHLPGPACRRLVQLPLTLIFPYVPNQFLRLVKSEILQCWREY